MAASIGRIKIPLSLTAEARAWPTLPFRARREETVQDGCDFPAGKGGQSSLLLTGTARGRLSVLTGGSSHISALGIGVKTVISMILTFIVHRPPLRIYGSPRPFPQEKKKKIHRGALSHTQKLHISEDVQKNS